MTDEQWIEGRVTNAWYSIAQEFQSGTMEDQVKRIKEVMEEAFEGGWNSGIKTGNNSPL
jgi:hypothetical protein